MSASNGEHAEIVRAIAAGDYARARKAGEKHIISEPADTDGVFRTRHTQRAGRQSD